jgi:hypothetical protein
LAHDSETSPQYYQHAVEPTVWRKDSLGKPLQISSSEGKASLPNARWRSGFWRSKE